MNARRRLERIERRMPAREPAPPAELAAAANEILAEAERRFEATRRALARRIAWRFGILREAWRDPPAVERHPLASIALDAACMRSRWPRLPGGKVPAPPKPSEPAPCPRCGHPMRWCCATLDWHRWQCRACCRGASLGLVQVLHDPAELAARAAAHRYGADLAARIGTTFDALIAAALAEREAR